MAKWEDLDNEFDEEEVNLALMGSTSSGAVSEVDSKDEDEMCFTTRSKLQSWYLDSGCSRHMT